MVGDHIDALKFDQRVAVQPSHQLGGPLRIGSEGFVAEIIFPPICYGAAFDQIHQGIGKEVGMHTQMAFTGQVSAKCLEEGPE